MGSRRVEESYTTARLHFHFSLSCIGEGNGTPLQCSCLENPRDGGAWWAAVYGVTQSWTRLKRLSSSSSSSVYKGPSSWEKARHTEGRNMGRTLELQGFDLGPARCSAWSPPASRFGSALGKEDWVKGQVLNGMFGASRGLSVLRVTTGSF